MSEPTRGASDRGTSRPESAAGSAPSPRIVERGVIALGLRIASAMSDAPRALLARAPLVVLPGPAFVWRDYETVMRRCAAERRVFALDWPGFGTSERLAGGPLDYTLERYTQVFAAWLEGMGIARAVLLASGIAAPVTLRFAAEHPQRVAGVALIGPAGFAAPGALRTMVARVASSPALLRRLWPLSTSLLLGPATVLTAPVAERHRLLRAAPEHGEALRIHAALWRSMPANTQLDAWARGVVAPTLVVRGALDPLVTAADARRAAETIGPQGALEITLPGAGHLPFLQQPERFAAALDGLLTTAEMQAAALS
ncbi:MAG: alpha/beta fold hydrolase [Ktedonobacterales bacterium]